MFHFYLIVVAFNYEKDVAEYTVKVATDPRAENGLVIYRLPKNVISQLELISRWEKKTGRTMERNYISEEEIIKLSQCMILRRTLSLTFLEIL